MLTCCPECETTFRLGANDLRRAQGRVRCGECAYVFNALEYLTEDAADDETAELTENQGDNPVYEPEDDVPANDTLVDEQYDADDIIEETAGAGILVTDSGDYDIAEAEAWNEAMADTLDEEVQGDIPADGNDDADDDSDDEADDDSDSDDEEDEPDAEEPVSDETEASTEEEFDASLADQEDAGPDDETDADSDEHEFDESAWERIPGIGSTAYSQTDEENEDIAGFSAANDAVADADDADSEAADGIPDAGDLEFNVPQEKWSNFFGSAPATPETPDWEAIAARTLGETHDDAVDEDSEAIADSDTNLADDSIDDSTGWLEKAADSWLDEDEESDESAAEASADDASPDGPVYSYDPNDGLDDEQDDYATTPPWQHEEYAPEILPDEPSRSGFWLLAGLLLLIVFTTQLVHYKRDALAAHPSFGSTVRSVYSQLGSETYPDWPIANYEIRGSEAVAGESGDDVLDIRTQIASIGETATGLPQLRVILRDRWSNPVAARHFNPEEYAVDGELPENGLLLPNETISAHVSIVDPGAGAQGFELELCLPRRDIGLDCTGQPFQ